MKTFLLLVCSLYLCSLVFKGISFLYHYDPESIIKKRRWLANRAEVNKEKWLEGAYQRFYEIRAKNDIDSARNLYWEISTLFDANESAKVSIVIMAVNEGPGEKNKGRPRAFYASAMNLYFLLQDFLSVEPVSQRTLWSKK